MQLLWKALSICPSCQTIVRCIKICHTCAKASAQRNREGTVRPIIRDSSRQTVRSQCSNVVVHYMEQHTMWREEDCGGRLGSGQLPFGELSYFGHTSRTRVVSVCEEWRLKSHKCEEAHLPPFYLLLHCRKGDLMNLLSCISVEKNAKETKTWKCIISWILRRTVVESDNDLMIWRGFII